MLNIIAIPYNSFQQKLNITKKLNHLGQRYSDLGGFIYYIKDNGIQEELSAGKLCWMEKNKY